MLLQPLPPAPLTVTVYDPAAVVAHLRDRVEQRMSEADTCAERGKLCDANAAWDRGARTSALVDALVEQHGLHVPNLLEQRRETVAKLERLQEPLPADVPASTRAWTCAARSEAIATLTERLGELDEELERYGARPAPDADALRVLPSWAGAWPTGVNGRSGSQNRSALGVA